MPDPFSDVLELVGVESSVYFQKDFLGPWCMDVSNTGFAQFHILVRGTAIVTHAGTTSTVQGGDIVFFPRGASHLIGDTTDCTPMEGTDVIQAMNEGREPFTEGTQATRMICGHFEYDFEYSHPMLEELPEMVLIRREKLPAKDQLFSLVKLIIHESNNDAPGSDVITRRLSDGLLVTILRSYFEHAEERSGFFRGLSDKRIAHAIAAIHNDVNNQLTIDGMAAKTGMSRSSFSKHFKELVGQSAGSYSTQWKLLKAKSAVTNSNASIEKIAFAHGYQSATAFTRAFHSMFGETPTQCRQRTKAEDPSG